MKQGKAQKIILIIIFLLLILLASIAYAYFATDIFKTPKQLFVKYLANNVTQITEFNFSPFSETFSKMNENLTELDLNISNEGQMGDINIKYLGDIKNRKESLICEIKEDDEQVLQADLAVTDDTYGIRLKGLHDKYLALENRDLKKFFANFLDENTVNVIPDKLTQLEPFSEEENEKLKNIYLKYYKKILDQFEDSIFTSEKGIEVDIDGEIVKANRYSITTSGKKLLEVFTNTITELTNDKEFLELYNKVNFEKNIEDLKTQNEQLKKSLDNSVMEDTKIVVSVYSADKRTVKTEISIDDTAGILEFMIKDNNNMVLKSNYPKTDTNLVGKMERFAITNNFTDNSGELIFENHKTYNQDDVKALENDLYEYSYTGYDDEKIKIKLQSTKNNDDLTTKIDLGDGNYSVTMNIKFNPNIKVDELTDENTLILNDYSKEDFNSLGEEILQNLSKTVEENPNYYISGLLMLTGFNNMEDLNNEENLTEDEGFNILEENTIETNSELVEKDPNEIGKRVDEEISGAIEKSLLDYHAEKEENPDTDPSNFLTVDAIQSNCDENMEIELIDGTTLKIVLEDKVYYTKINIDGNTWELVETETLYSENGDLETAEPIE